MKTISRAPQPLNEPITATFRDLKADYDGMRPSKYQRERAYLGGSADSHLGYSWVGYWRLREYCRDMMRNHGIIGQALQRACDNIFGDGFQLDYVTSDKGLNETLDALFLDWATDPMQCDARQTSTFDEMARLAWKEGATLLSLRFRCAHPRLCRQPLRV